MLFGDNFFKGYIVGYKGFWIVSGGGVFGEVVVVIFVVFFIFGEEVDCGDVWFMDVWKRER